MSAILYHDMMIVNVDASEFRHDRDNSRTICYLDEITCIYSVQTDRLQHAITH